LVFLPSKVFFLKAETIETNIEAIQESMSSLIKDSEDEPTDLFDKMVKWLRENEA
jgi:hypothetical protein